jgi:hypothetical protein
VAFGITRKELLEWKKEVTNGNIAFLTHYWFDPRFPDSHCVTKVGCSDVQKLIAWGENYELRKEWIHFDGDYPHFDLLGDKQKEILKREGLTHHLERFKIK